ncbi:MAG: hypothetical protein ACJATW_002098 [Glaciecola sp.]|jgi:hypothetical protein
MASENRSKRADETPWLSGVAAGKSFAVALKDTKAKFKETALVNKHRAAIVDICKTQWEIILSSV